MKKIFAKLWLIIAFAIAYLCVPSNALAYMLVEGIEYDIESGNGLSYFRDGNLIVYTSDPVSIVFTMVDPSLKVTSCSITNSFGATATFENGKCKIDTDDLGSFSVLINYQGDGWESSSHLYAYSVSPELFNEIESRYFANRDLTYYEYKRFQSGNYFLDNLIYYYSNCGYTENGYQCEGDYNIPFGPSRPYSFGGKISGLDINIASSMTQGYTEGIWVNDRDINDILVLIDDESILSYENGLFTALKEGKTKIYFIDKKTNDIYISQMEVYADSLTLTGFTSEEIINKINEFPKTINMDAKDYSQDFYRAIEADVKTNIFGEEHANIQYGNVYINTNYDWMTDLYNINFEYGGASYEIRDIAINLYGVEINSSVPYGASYMLSDFARSYENGQLLYSYDEAFFEIDEENQMINFIKHGCSDFTVTVGSYTNTTEVCIGFSYEESEEFMAFNNTNKVIELGYNETDFNNNLDYLEQIVAEKYNEMIPNKFKEFANPAAFCISPKLCIIKTGNILLESGYAYKTIKYKATDSSLRGVDSVISLLKDAYVISFDDYIKVLNDVKGNEISYYDKLVSLLNIDDKLSSASLTKSIVNKKQFSIENEIYGNMSFTLNLISNSKVVYSKDIVILVSPFLEIPIEVAHTDEGRKEYAKDYLQNLLNNQNIKCTVNNQIISATINDEYTIKFSYSQDPIISAESMYSTYDFYELSTGQEAEIAFTYYPDNANAFPKATIKSQNENIIKVTEDGKIRALKKGYTYIGIETELGYYFQVLVLVDMTIDEMLNLFAHDINIDVEVSYVEYRNNGENAVLYQIKPQTMMNDSVWYNIMGELVKDGKNLYYQKTYTGASSTKEFDKYKSDLIKINYTLKGIYIESEEYHVDLNEKIKIKMSYTEGDNSRLYYRVENPGIVSFDINGNLVGLKSGITRVDVYAKKESYYNYFYVFVDEDKYFTNKLKELEKNGVVVDAHYVTWSVSDGVYYEITDALNYYMIDYDIACNEENHICNFKMYTENKTYEANVPYKIEGITYEGEYNVLLSTGDKHQLKLTNYTTSSNKKLYFDISDTNVCAVSSSGEVTAKKAGVCGITVSNIDGNTTSLAVVVDEAKIAKDLNKLYDKLPNEINAKLMPYDPETAGGDDTEAQYIYINELLKTYFNDEYEYYFSFSLLESVESDDGAMEVYLYRSYPSDNGLWSATVAAESSKRIKVNYLNKPVVPDANLETIKEALKQNYELTLIEALTYKFTHRGIGSIVNYCSEFTTSIRKHAKYDFLFDPRAGSGPSDISASEGGFVIVTYDGAPVYVTTSFFTARYYLPSDAPQNQEAFIKYLAEVIKNAYIELRDSGTSVYGVGMTTEPRAQLYTRETVVEPEVIVEYISNSGTGELYWATIDGEGFGIEVTRDENVDYPDMVTDIKLDASEVTLELGASKKINYTLEPVGAAKAKVYWFTSNANVAKVENGNIVATGAGNAIITASVDGVSATVKVTVENKKLSDIITEEGYKVSSAYVHGFKLNEAISSLQNKFGNDIKINTNAKVIGTGTEFTYKDQIFTAVIYGDLSGDGVINSLDLLKMRQHLLDTSPLKGAYKQAAAIANGTTINSLDLLRLRQHMLGTYTIKQ